MSKESLLDRWKVGVSFVAGVLVVSTVWGTCSYEPEFSTETASEEVVEQASEEAQTEPSVTPTSATTEASVTTVESTSTTDLQSSTHTVR